MLVPLHRERLFCSTRSFLFCSLWVDFEGFACRTDVECSACSDSGCCSNVPVVLIGDDITIKRHIVTLVNDRYTRLLIVTVIDICILRQFDRVAVYHILRNIHFIRNAVQTPSVLLIFIEQKVISCVAVYREFLCGVPAIVDVFQSEVKSEIIPASLD